MIFVKILSFSAFSGGDQVFGKLLNYTKLSMFFCGPDEYEITLLYSFVCFFPNLELQFLNLNILKTA